LLLLRDCAYDEKEQDIYETFECGYYDENTKPDGQEINFFGEQLYLDQNPDEELTASALECQKTVLDSFESTAMYLMAHPGLGEHLPNPNECDSTLWLPKFRECVKDLVTRILEPSELSR